MLAWVKSTQYEIILCQIDKILDASLVIGSYLTPLLIFIQKNDYTNK